MVAQKRTTPTLGRAIVTGIAPGSLGLLAFSLLAAMPLVAPVLTPSVASAQNFLDPDDAAASDTSAAEGDNDLDSKSAELMNRESALLRKLDSKPAAAPSGARKLQVQGFAAQKPLAPARKIVPATQEVEVVREAPAEAQPEVAHASANIDRAAAQEVQADDDFLDVAAEEAPQPKPAAPKKIAAPVKKKEAPQEKDDSAQKLAVSQNRIELLVKELEDTRNRLMIAETEVERLSSIIQERNRSKLASYGTQAKKVPLKPSQPAALAAPALRPIAVNPAAESKIDNDMEIATVVVDKAYLRTGAGTNNSPLMSVGKGTRLAVEKRVGEWYRVISPAGTRAWVSADVVNFGVGSASAQQAGRISGYDENAENKAFGLVRKRTAP